MNRTGTTREVWHPQSPHERELVLRELHDVLASPHFCNSKRYPAMLKYIVERTLAGEGDQLKERTLGVEVFERPPDYDTNADTVVRYTAGEVRKRLSLYYHELGRKTPVQILLPAGSYVPEFVPMHEGDRGIEAHQHADGREAGIAVRVPELAGPGSHGVPIRRPVSGLPPYLLPAGPKTSRSRWKWVTAAVLLTAAALFGGWRYRTLHTKTALDEFWGPVLRDQSTVMVCIGGSVFDQTRSSGVSTAGKDTDYPFVSLQSASALAQLSTLLGEKGGITPELRTSANTPLTDLREHPVILLGGYNNQWTMRLVEPLRIHFVPINGTGEIEEIVDTTQPGKPVGARSCATLFRRG